MEPLTIGAAARQTGWSPRMLRYLEQAELVEPQRSARGYRRYGLTELNRLRSLRGLELEALEWEQAKHERLLVA